MSAAVFSRWTTMIAAVRSEILLSTSDASRPSESSISANTGTAPAHTTAFTVAMNVKDGTMTSSPQPTPRAARATRSAAVPLEVATACVAPSSSHAAASKAATLPSRFGP